MKNSKRLKGVDMQRLLTEDKYNFLQTPEMKESIILLGLGGSISYGTDSEDSDIDLRGVRFESPQSLFTMKKDNEVFVNQETDTKLQMLSSFIKRLGDMKPEETETLGLPIDQYTIMTDYGRILHENRKLFISKKCINSFKGQCDGIDKTMNKAIKSLENLMTQSPEHFYKGVKTINKALMNQVRIMYMLFDLVEKEDFIARRTFSQREELLKIKNGCYFDSLTHKVSEDFYRLRDALLEDWEYMAESNSLPEHPDWDSIIELEFELNKMRMRKLVENGLLTSSMKFK